LPIGDVRWIRRALDAVLFAGDAVQEKLSVGVGGVREFDPDARLKCDSVNPTRIQAAADVLVLVETPHNCVGAWRHWLSLPLPIYFAANRVGHRAGSEFEEIEIRFRGNLPPERQPPGPDEGSLEPGLM